MQFLNICFLFYYSEKYLFLDLFVVEKMNFCLEGEGSEEYTEQQNHHYRTSVVKLLIMQFKFRV